MNRQEKLFEEDSVWRGIAAMALPAMVSMVVMILYNMADLFFVGFLGDTAQVAAVSVVGPVFNVILAAGSMIGAGTCALTARTLGAGDREKVKLYSALCCWGSLLVGAALTVVLLFARTPLLRLLGANEEMWSFAKAYLEIIALGAPAMVFTAASGSMLRGVGVVTEAMAVNLFSTFLNIALDAVMILGLQMGVAGAAAATVISNIVGAALLLVLLRGGRWGLSLSLSRALSHPAAFGEILAIGLPSAVSTGLASVASACANSLMSSFGTAAVAAMAAAGKATMVISMLQMGLCMGVQPLLAYRYGAKDMVRLRETLRKLTVLTVLIGLSLAVLCFAGSGAVVGLFLKEEEAFLLGQRMVRVMVLSGPFLGLFYIGSNFLQASGNAPAATLISMLRQGLFLIPLLYLLTGLAGVNGCLWAHVAADTGSAAVSVVLALRQYRKLAGIRTAWEKEGMVRREEPEEGSEQKRMKKAGCL